MKGAPLDTEGERDAIQQARTDATRGRRNGERHQPAPSPPPRQNRALGGPVAAFMMAAGGQQPLQRAAPTT